MQDSRRGGVLHPAARGGKGMSLKLELDGAAYDQLVKVIGDFVDESIRRLEDIEAKLERIIMEVEEDE